MMSKGTLLIIDDIPDNVKILFKFLVDAGFKVLVAQDGSQGIRVTERIHPDLILLDIMMPGLNGFEVCRLLKSHEDTKNIPIIFMTALVDTDNKVKGFKLGAADYITKPFQQEEVLVRVTTHIHLNQQQRQLQAQAELLQIQKQTLYQKNKQLQEEIDIRKQIEMSLQQHATMLADRTVELQTRSIELEKRNMELDAFAHTVAHDLKNPLTVITGIADLLLQHCSTTKPTEPRYIEGLHVMVQTSQKMYSIVESILLLAGISRKTELEIKPLEMSSILNQVTQRLAEVINEYHAEVQLPQQWPIAVGYAPWVEEIWFNYLSNGCKYGGRPPCLELGAELLTTDQVDQNGVTMVRFWVRDNVDCLLPSPDFIKIALKDMDLVYL